MEKTYNKIVKSIEKIGINSKLENKSIKVLDLESGILMYDKKTGWLALRKELKSSFVSSETRRIPFNKVLYKNSNTPYCLYGELKKVLNQITGQ
jgi:hypothetical protein